MRRRIRTTLAKCDLCQRCKIDTHPPIGVASGIACTAKNDQISVDIIGPLPRAAQNLRFILITIDIFTKYVSLYPLQKSTTRIILNKLLNIHFPIHGFPNKIQSDNGTQFKSKLWTQTMEQNNITLIYSPIYRPKSNLAERPIREIKRCLRTYCTDNHRKWATHLPVINQFLNEVIHDTTGYTPNELQFGQKDHRFWEDVVKNPFIPEENLDKKLEIAATRIQEKRAQRAEKLNNGKRFKEFNIGDLVLIKNHPISNAIEGETARLFHIFQGPFVIYEKLGRNTYHVQAENSERIYGPIHVSAMKAYLQ